MRYDILIGLEKILTVTIIVGKMSNDLATQIINEERRKRKLKPLKNDDYITFLPVVGEEI